MEAIIRRIAIFILSMCKIVGYGISIVLVGVYYALVVHDKNIAIFNAMNPVSLDVVDFSKLPRAHRNAIMKNGFAHVWIRNISMFSLLTSLRCILMYNPFLFVAQLSFTNQFTNDIPPDERTTENFQLLELILHTFTGKTKENKSLDAVGYNPNFIDTDIDDGQFDDIGLQYISIFTAYIQMEYLKYKPGTRLFDYRSPIIEDGTKRKK